MVFIKKKDFEINKVRHWVGFFRNQVTLTDDVAVLVELEEYAAVEHPFVTIVLRDVGGNDDVAVTVEDASAFSKGE